MRNIEQLLEVIPHASFVKIDEEMFRVNGHIIESEEKEVYILNENSSETYVYNLNNTEDLKLLQNANFYSIQLISEDK